MIRHTITALALLAAAGVAGCGERVEAGLANAPSLQRQSRPRNEHDVISNGPDSCPRSQNDTDPLVNRTPPCGEAPSAPGSPTPP
jgi:hypothetical protein